MKALNLIVLSIVGMLAALIGYGVLTNAGSNPYISGPVDLERLAWFAVACAGIALIFVTVCLLNINERDNKHED